MCLAGARKTFNKGKGPMLINSVGHFSFRIIPILMSSSKEKYEHQEIQRNHEPDDGRRKKSADGAFNLYFHLLASNHFLLLLGIV